MFNRYPAKCAKCGASIPPGGGVVVNHGTSQHPVWKTVCNKHWDFSNVKKIYRPKIAEGEGEK